MRVRVAREGANFSFFSMPGSVSGYAGLNSLIAFTSANLSHKMPLFVVQIL